MFDKLKCISSKPSEAIMMAVSSGNSTPRSKEICISARKLSGFKEIADTLPTFTPAKRTSVPTVTPSMDLKLAFNTYDSSEAPKPPRWNPTTAKPTAKTKTQVPVMNSAQAPRIRSLRNPCLVVRRRLRRGVAQRACRGMGHCCTRKVGLMWFFPCFMGQWGVSGRFIPCMMQPSVPIRAHPRGLSFAVENHPTFDPILGFIKNIARIIFAHFHAAAPGEQLCV